MTSAICAGSSEGDTKQLVDTRDGNKYYVAKMKDGNCWMTQNLALDITTAGLKASDTDIESDWNSSSEYPPTNTLDIGQAGSSSSTSTSSWRGSNVTNGHDSSGNYYSFNAATADTRVGGNSRDRSGSICPKGWRLPTGGRTTKAGTDEYIPSNSNEFYKLLYAYGYPVNTSYTADSSGGSTALSQPGAVNLALEPMYFVYGGRLYSNSGKVSTGEVRYWSSTAYSGSSYCLYASSSEIRPAAQYHSLDSGFSVRCVAR